MAALRPNELMRSFDVLFVVSLSNHCNKQLICRWVGYILIIWHIAMAMWRLKQKMFFFFFHLNWSKYNVINLYSICSYMELRISWNNKGTFWNSSALFVKFISGRLIVVSKVTKCQIKRQICFLVESVIITTNKKVHHPRVKKAFSARFLQMAIGEISNTRNVKQRP